MAFQRRIVAWHASVNKTIQITSNTNLMYKHLSHSKMSNLVSSIIDETLWVLYPTYAHVFTIILAYEVTLTYCAQNKYVLFLNKQHSILFPGLLNPPPLTNFSNFNGLHGWCLGPRNSTFLTTIDQMPTVVSDYGTAIQYNCNLRDIVQESSDISIMAMTIIDYRPKSEWNKVYPNQRKAK